jgi:hypothetical protein
MKFKPSIKALANKIASLIDDPSASSFFLEKLPSLEANDGLTVRVQSQDEYRNEYVMDGWRHGDPLPDTVQVRYTINRLRVDDRNGDWKASRMLHGESKEYLFDFLSEVANSQSRT